jgi:hypothetical protein
MKDFFNHEDFMRFDFRYEITDIANAKLNALIEAAPLVYYKNIELIKDNYCWIENNPHVATKTARLMFIEEIKREPCR